MRRDLQGLYLALPGDTARAIAAYRRALADPASTASADKARERLKALQR